MEAAVEGGLARAAILREQQRVQINPTSTGADQLHPVRPPVGLHRVAEPVQNRQGGPLARDVDVHVDVPMRPSLVPY